MAGLGECKGLGFPFLVAVVTEVPGLWPQLPDPPVSSGIPLILSPGGYTLSHPFPGLWRSRPPSRRGLCPNAWGREPGSRPLAPLPTQQASQLPPRSGAWEPETPRPPHRGAAAAQLQLTHPTAQRQQAGLDAAWGARSVVWG